MLEPVVRPGLASWMQMTVEFGLVVRDHIFPLDDYRAHDLDEHGTCWCRPELDPRDPTIWVHQAMDGREDFETGLRQVS